MLRKNGETLLNKYFLKGIVLGLFSLHYLFEFQDIRNTLTWIGNTYEYEDWIIHRNYRSMCCLTISICMYIPYKYFKIKVTSCSKLINFIWAQVYSISNFSTLIKCNATVLWILILYIYSSASALKPKFISYIYNFHSLSMLKYKCRWQELTFN